MPRARKKNEIPREVILNRMKRSQKTSPPPRRRNTSTSQLNTIFQNRPQKKSEPGGKLNPANTKVGRQLADNRDYKQQVINDLLGK